MPLRKRAQIGCPVPRCSRAISKSRVDQANTQIEQVISKLERQIAALPKNDTVGRDTLSGQLQRARSLRAVGQNPSSGIIERAAPASSPSNHNTRRALELGFVLALLLGFGAVAIAENSDRRVRSPDDLEEMTGLPLLSAIPASAFDPAEDEDLRDEEAFQMLRGALMYFNVDQRLKSVVITSPGQEDGKTTVAIRLAQFAVEPVHQLAHDRLPLGLDLLVEPRDDRAVLAPRPRLEEFLRLLADELLQELLEVV